MQMGKITNEYDIGEAFAAIENELIASMMRNISRHKAWEKKENKEWTMWQVEQLKELEKFKKENQAKYPQVFKDLNRKIEELLRMAEEEGQMDQEAEILQAIKDGFPAREVEPGTTAEFFKLNNRKLEALIQATNNDMQKAETAVLRMAEDQYRKIIYNAQVYANTGAGTYEKAIDMATRDFLAAGLTCIEYKNGARHTLSDYADMAIRTASKRAYLQGEGVKRQEWKISTVIINKRGDNPCPKCLPFVGKVMIDDVWSNGPKDGKSPVTGKQYPLISSAIAAGLYHPRCRDSHTTYFEGISTPPEGRFKKKELNDLVEKNRQEAKQQYAERQVEKYERLTRYSLDPENQQQYATKRDQWKHARFRTGEPDSRKHVEQKRPLANFRAVPQEKVVDLLRGESKEWIDSLSGKEKHAIEKYTFNSGDQKPDRFFERLNRMLRGAAPEDATLREYANTISSALKKSKLEHDVICYRNLMVDPIPGYSEGDILSLNQFTSTSVVSSGAFKAKYKITIYAPKGVKAAYIEELSKFKSQRELLIDKDCLYRVISKKEASIELEAIP